MSDLLILDGTGSLQTIHAPNANGQTDMDNSRPVVIASNQSTIPVSLASLPSLPAGANAIGSVTISGSVAVTGTFWQATQPVSGTVTANAGSGTFTVSPVAPSTTARLLSSAASTNATSVKASSGTIRAIQGYNNRASPVYLKIYNKASAPTVGTDTPVKTIYLPASSAFALDFSFTFSAGIAFALTGGPADADATAIAIGDILCLNVDYI